MSAQTLFFARIGNNYLNIFKLIFLHYFKSSMDQPFVMMKFIIKSPLFIIIYHLVTGFV
jgi:hypothetical protein